MPVARVSGNSPSGIVVVVVVVFVEELNCMLKIGCFAIMKLANEAANLTVRYNEIDRFRQTSNRQTPTNTPVPLFSISIHLSIYPSIDLSIELSRLVVACSCRAATLIANSNLCSTRLTTPVAKVVMSH